MKWISYVALSLAVGCQSPGSRALDGDGPASLLPGTVIPTASLETRTQSAGWGQRSWLDQVDDIRRGARELAPEIVLIGDSITQNWAGAGRSVGGPGSTARKRWLDPLGPVLNAGIAGDRTQHVLWRLKEGMLAGCPAKFIVVMIGTNNLPEDSAEEIVLGVEAILLELRVQLPEATVLLLGCPPRGTTRADPLREKSRALNSLLTGGDRGPKVRWLDVTPLLVDEEGENRGGRMASDGVHLSAAGYEVLGEVIRDAFFSKATDC